MMQPRSLLTSLFISPNFCTRIFAGALACACATLLLPASATTQTDAEKKRRIETMIGEFEHKWNVPQMDAASAQQALKDANTVLLDVREEKERNVSTIPGAITRREFEANPDAYKTRKIIVYCTIGYRSARYAAWFNKRGYQMHNLRGSLLLWAHANGPLINAQGAPTRQLHVYGRDWDLLPAGYQSIY